MSSDEKGLILMQRHDRQEADFPDGLSAPARRALAAAGYSWLEQLAGASEDGITRLHGIGPRALDLLRHALSARGLSFAASGRKEG